MKYVLAILLSLGVFAGGTYELKTINTKRGTYAYIVNHTNYDLNCWIGDYEFTVMAYDTSLYYPYNNDWGCE